MRLLVDAVVAMTGRSESTVFRRVRAGVLPLPRKIGPGAVRWIESELVEAINRLPVADWAETPAVLGLFLTIYVLPRRLAPNASGRRQSA